MADFRLFSIVPISLTSSALNGGRGAGFGAKGAVDRRFFSHASNVGKWILFDARNAGQPSAFAVFSSASGTFNIALAAAIDSTVVGVFFIIYVMEKAEIAFFHVTKLKNPQSVPCQFPAKESSRVPTMGEGSGNCPRASSCSLCLCAPSFG
jgi:hypothetical protein